MENIVIWVSKSRIPAGIHPAIAQNRIEYRISEGSVKEDKAPDQEHIQKKSNFNAPQIEQVNMNGYSGAVGSTITVTVTDGFVVSSVHVKVENMDGTLVEEGEAVQGNTGIDWVYTATVANENLSGDKNTVAAYDMPGNTDNLESEIPAR